MPYKTFRELLEERRREGRLPTVRPAQDEMLKNQETFAGGPPDAGGLGALQTATLPRQDAAPVSVSDLARREVEAHPEWRPGEAPVRTRGLAEPGGEAFNRLPPGVSGPVLPREAPSRLEADVERDMRFGPSSPFRATGEVEPFQEEAFKAEQEAKKPPAWLAYLLGGVARGRQGGGILPGLAQEYQRRNDPEREALTVTPRQRAFVKERMGVDVPEGANWAEYSQILPAIAQAVRANEISPYQSELLDMRRVAEDRYQKGLGFRERELELQETMQPARLEQTKLNRDLRRELANRVPVATAVELARTTFVIKGIQKIKDRYEEVKDELGPIWGRWNRIMRLFDPTGKFSDPDAVATISQLSFQMSQFIYNMTGKQMNEQEMKRLQDVLPQAWDNQRNFIAILDSFVEGVTDYHDSVLNALEKTGIDVQKFRDGDASRPTAGGPTREFKVEGDPNSWLIPESQVADFLKDHPWAKEVSGAR